jgi:hypothetical protein
MVREARHSSLGALGGCSRFGFALFDRFIGSSRDITSIGARTPAEG